jgi:DNA polymerase I-like protein with 3'-5' exonuclease and polymerase domains
VKFKKLNTAVEVLNVIRQNNHESEFVVLDTETTDKNPRLAKLIDIQMSCPQEDCAVLFDAEHLPLLTRIKVPVVLHNFKYDFIVAHRHGVDLRCLKVYDTMLMHQPR